VGEMNVCSNISSAKLIPQVYGKAPSNQQIEDTLKDLGIISGCYSNNSPERLKEAIRDFQHLAGLSETGEIDQATTDMLALALVVNNLQDKRMSLSLFYKLVKDERAKGNLKEALQALRTASKNGKLDSAEKMNIVVILFGKDVGQSVFKKALNYGRYMVSDEASARRDTVIRNFSLKKLFRGERGPMFQEIPEEKVGELNYEPYQPLPKLKPVDGIMVEFRKVRRGQTPPGHIRHFTIDPKKLVPSVAFSAKDRVYAPVAKLMPKNAAFATNMTFVPGREQLELGQVNETFEQKYITGLAINGEVISDLEPGKPTIFISKSGEAYLTNFEAKDADNLSGYSIVFQSLQGANEVEDLGPRYKNVAAPRFVAFVKEGKVHFLSSNLPLTLQELSNYLFDKHEVVNFLILDGGGSTAAIVKEKGNKLAEVIESNYNTHAALCWTPRPENKTVASAK